MDHLVPEDLWVEIHAAAPSIQQALENAFNGAREIANIIGFTANAHVGDLYPEIGFEVTPCVSEREFFQAFLAERPVSVVPGRVFNVSVVRSMIGALATHSDRDRLLRGITQYQIALEHWTLGDEIASIAHLFMAVENITIAALRKHLMERRIDEATLAKEWGFKAEGTSKQAPYLKENARLRLIFHGDVDCHRDAKWVSDHFEHGLKNFGVLRPKARPALVRTAHHVRRAIIDVSNVSSDAAAIMSGSAFSRPRGPLKLVKYLYGRLQGDPDGFAAPGQLYPSFVWQSKLDKVTVDEKGQYGFAPKETFTAKFGKGVRFKNPRFEIWDGAVLNDQPANPPQLKS
ncbi:MAG: hypothetical protein ACKVQA_09865 [Burkholderiales bacterium]